MGFRVLAPAGGFASPWAIFKTWNARRQPLAALGASQLLERRLRELYTVPETVVFGSGKDALSALFQLIAGEKANPLVAISAYTCPDIAAAALRAGCKVFPIDTLEDSLEPDPTAISSEQLEKLHALVLSNLYGLPDSLAPWLQLFSNRNVVVIDDACQASHSSRQGVRVGGNDGTAGILSFGRGKSICGAGGGAILLNKAVALLSSKESAGFLQLQKSKDESPTRTFKHLLLGAGAWLFERPQLYGAIAALPGLELGQTNCSLEWQVAALSTGQALHALAQIERSDVTANTFRSNAKIWSELLGTVSLRQPYVERGFLKDESVVPIRYPLIFGDSQTRDAVNAQLTANGLGASSSYPATLHGYPALQPGIFSNDTPRADSVSRRILTLPVHQYVRREDMVRATALIGQICGYR